MSEYIENKIRLLGSLALKSTEVVFHVPKGASENASAGDKEILELINHMIQYNINIYVEEKEFERVVTIR